MPNWCENLISITSDTEPVIDHIYNIIMSDDDLNLMSLRPEPEDVEDSRRWRLDNWGTKWSLDIITIDRTHWQTHTSSMNYHEISVSALSAWGPPLDLLQYITKVYPVAITCSFQEGGFDFIGFAHFENGQMRVSEGRISDNLPDGFDWDDDDATEVYNDTVDRLLCEHETLALQREMAS